jgi:hypothetical protein
MLGLFQPQRCTFGNLEASRKQSIQKVNVNCVLRRKVLLLLLLLLLSQLADETPKLFLFEL